MEHGRHRTKGRIATSVVLFVLTAMLALMVSSSSARSAGPASSAWALRGGFSSDPSQGIVGVQLILRELAQNLCLAPNADIGIGTHVTLTLNADVVYELALADASRLYFGGAAALIRARTDRHDGGNKTRGGVAGVFGYRFPAGDLPLSLEMRLGISERYPGLRLLVGYSFLP